MRSTALAILLSLFTQIISPVAAHADDDDGGGGFYGTLTYSGPSSSDPFNAPWVQSPDWFQNQVYQGVQREGNSPAVQNFIHQMQTGTGGVATDPTVASNQKLLDQIKKDASTLQQQLQTLSLPPAPQYPPNFPKSAVDSITQPLWDSVGWDSSTTPPSDGKTRANPNLMNAPQALDQVYAKQAAYMALRHPEIAVAIGEQISVFTDSSGLFTGLPNELRLPGPLFTAVTSDRGREVRLGLNRTLLADSVIQTACSGGSADASSCSQLRQAASGIGAGYLLAERISQNSDPTDYQNLMSALNSSADFLVSFASELLQGTATIAAAAAVVALLPAELAAGATLLAGGALVAAVGAALYDYPDTLQAIKTGVRGTEDTLINGSASDKGALLGKISSVIAGALLWAPVSSAAQGVLSSAVEWTADRVVVETLIASDVNAGDVTVASSAALSDLAATEPQLAIELIQDANGSVSSAIENNPDLTLATSEGLSIDQKLGLLEKNLLGQPVSDLIALGNESATKVQISGDVISMTEASKDSLQSALASSSSMQAPVSPPNFTEIQQAIETSLDFSSDGKTIVLYSGSSEAQAQAFAYVSESPDTRVMIDLTPGGKYLRSLDLSGDGEFKAAWSAASERFVNGASGQVQVFTGNPYLENQFEGASRILVTTEIPAALANPSITKIQVQAVTGAP